MSKANILFLIVLIISFTPQLGFIYLTLRKADWAKGLRLLIESSVLWIIWIFFMTATGIFFGLNEETSMAPTIGFIFKLHALRIAVLVFASTGICAGVLLTQNRINPKNLPFSKILENGFSA